MGRASTRQNRNNNPVITVEENKAKDHTAEFKLERYKYLLNQIHSLNENTQRYLALYQTLLTAILGGGVALFVYWRSLSIPAQVATIGMRSLLGLLVIITLYILFSVFVGIFSWMDYRREEVKLLDEMVGPGYRSPPRLKNVWRWYETYLIIFIMFITTVVILFVERQIIPLMV